LDKRLIIINTIIFDVILSVLFIASNLWIWDYLNRFITANVWGPLQIAIIPQTIVNGQLEVIGTFGQRINYPFILFWIALIGNFILMTLALKAKDKN
jgi:hypothetical protein